MTFDEWHDAQLNGDPDRCPHEEWERKAWLAGRKAALLEVASIVREKIAFKIASGSPYRGMVHVVIEQLRRMAEEGLK